MKKHLKVLCGAVAVVLAGQVSASATWTWNSSSGDNSPNPISKTVDGATTVTATPTGWANTDGNNIEQQSGATGYNSSQYTHFVTYSGGLGINNNDGCAGDGCSGDQGDMRNDAPEHAIDNDGRYEMVMLSFNDVVKLTKVQIGWAGSTDSDITVMAYQQGAGAPVLTGKTFTAASLTGWSLIGNYADVYSGPRFQDSGLSWALS